MLAKCAQVRACHPDVRLRVFQGFEWPPILTRSEWHEVLSMFISSEDKMAALELCLRKPHVIAMAWDLTMILSKFPLSSRRQAFDLCMPWVKNKLHLGTWHAMFEVIKTCEDYEGDLIPALSPCVCAKFQWDESWQIPLYYVGALRKCLPLFDDAGQVLVRDLLSAPVPTQPIRMHPVEVHPAPVVPRSNIMPDGEDWILVTK